MFVSRAFYVTRVELCWARQDMQAISGGNQGDCSTKWILHRGVTPFLTFSPPDLLSHFAAFPPILESLIIWVTLDFT